VSKIILTTASVVALAACGQGSGAAQTESGDAGASGDYTRAEIEEIVHDYILENPEIIEEALVELQARARDRERDAQSAAVQANSDALFEDDRDPVIGDGPITIVEFFDYNCGYCRLAGEWVQDTLDEHGDQVRFVYKEFPILGRQSTEASLAALAVWRTQPDRYEAFHDAMISASGELPSERIDSLAEDAGVDVEEMRAAMDDEAIQRHIADVRGLARTLGVTGTPFFIVDGEVVPMADIEALNAALNSALES
jgi:protein-disulfide isomerase